MAHTVSIEYQDGLPAWRARIVQPERFKDVDYSVQVKLFRMPRGALVSAMLKLYDVPDQPYFVHRVMDLSDPVVARHVRACAEQGRMVLIFESSGESPDVQRTVDIDGEAWGRTLRDGERHNKGIRVDGVGSVDDFLGVFTEASRAGGVEAGWSQVEERFHLIDAPAGAQKRPAADEEPAAAKSPPADKRKKFAIEDPLVVALALAFVLFGFAGPWALLMVHPWAAISLCVAVLIVLFVPKRAAAGGPRQQGELLLFLNSLAALIAAIRMLAAH